MTGEPTFRQLSLVVLATLVGCGTESGDLPSAPGPSITAHRSGSSDVPSPRGYPLMTYDPIGDQVYLFGGFYSFGFESEIFDVWTFNPQSRVWKQVSDELPPKNPDALALDVRSRQVVLFQPYFAEVETWAYDIETGAWENRHPAVEPLARWGSMMVYDSESDRILLYGGTDLYGGEQVLGDLWAYDYEANTWTELHPPVSPPAHHFPALVYVPTMDRVVLFGGYQQGFVTLFNDTWAYDFNANRWVDLQPTDAPAPRAYHYLAFEPTTNRIVMFGGTLDESNWPNEPTIGETWLYDVTANAWSQVFPKRAPSPRAWHAMVGTNRRAVLFGGGASRWTYTNDTFLYGSRSNQWKRVLGEDDDDHEITRR